MIYDLIYANVISMVIMKMLPPAPMTEIVLASQAACLPRPMRRERYNVPPAR